MFGQAGGGGGGMWPPTALTNASGGPPTAAANGVPPFNGLYSGLGPPGASQSHHLTHFVQPHAYSAAAAAAQQSAMMQRQLGSSHLLTNHQRVAAAAAMAAASGGPQGGLMAPPASNNMRVVELQEKRKQEAEKRRRAEEERQKAAKASEEFFTSSGLFEEPQKLASHQADDQVSQVLGRFDHAQTMMNCIGVDYQPPTPAPANHHIIGDDDEPGHSSSSSRSSSHGSHAINPATALYGGGAHSGHHQLQHKRPYPHTVSRHPPSSRSSLPPPSMPPPPSQHNRARPPPPLMGPPTMSMNSVRSSESSRMKDASRNLSKLNLEKVNSDQDIDKIFSEMINPSGAGGTAMPPPLSAIITPRVSKHEGNSRNAPPKYFSTVSPPSHKSPELEQPVSLRQASNNMTSSASVSNSAVASKTLPGVGNSRLSEDSESDHEKLPPSTLGFNPCVNLIEKKPSAMTSKPQHGTTSESSESEDSSSEDSSTDDDSKNSNNKKTKKSKLGTNANNQANHQASNANLGATTSVATSEPLNENVDMDNSFSLNNLLNKVKKQSPGPPSITAPTSVASSEVSPEDISDMLSQKRSPFPDNLILGAAVEGHAKPILDIARPLSPLQESPPTSQRSKKYRQRSHKKPSMTSIASSYSSDEEQLPSSKPTSTSKSKLKPSESPRMRPTPKKTALAQISTSQDEEEISSSLSKSTAAAASKQQRRNRKTASKVLPTASSSAPPPADNSWSISSSSEEAGVESDDEAKDASYGNYRKSPSKRKKSTPTKSSAADIKSELNKDGGQEESAKKRAAISRIFPVKKSASRSPAPAQVSGGGGKSGVKTEVKTEPLVTSILKRLDGRPILMCRIPYNAINRNSLTPLSASSGRKRERKISTASSSSTKSSSKKHKRSSKELQDQEAKPPPPVEIKPEATNLVHLPGYATTPTSSSTARNLMPPPVEKKAENHVVGGATDEDDEFQIYMTQAKKLKHEADRDSNNRETEKRVMKYLEAVMYFILCGNLTESRGDHAAAYTMYKETLSLVNHVSRPLGSSERMRASGTADNKLNILSLRCQSLLNLKLYKLRRIELKECQHKLEELLNIAAKNGLLMSPGGSPTPSPAGSEESGYSKSSGYTSSGELPITPASNSAASSCLGGTMSVPHNLMLQQYHYSYYLTQCHELWEMADMYTHRGHCQDFIAHLDQKCGPLTLHSSLRDLQKYTQAGLDYLAKERENLHRARRQ